MKLLKILTVTVLVCFLALVVMPIHGEEGIYENVIRLHVIANSDSEADQALKLAVRDAVLEICAPRLSSCHSREQAEAAVEEMREKIVAVARETLSARGCEDSVTVALGVERYPEKRYESLCFPSGSYLSLRVCIGEAAGQNWWCVLFPPICTAVATASGTRAEDSFVAAGFTPEQYRIITETDEVTYRLRFKILEVLEGVFGK